METEDRHKFVHYIPYRRKIYEPLNRTSSQIVRVAAASGIADEFRIVLPVKEKNKNSTNSVYLRLYGAQRETLCSEGR